MTDRKKCPACDAPCLHREVLKESGEDWADIFACGTRVLHFPSNGMKKDVVQRTMTCLENEVQRGLLVIDLLERENRVLRERIAEKKCHDLS